MMSALALKIGSVVTTLLVLAGSYAYAAANPKNPAAPLQPPVAGRADLAPAGASPTPLPSLVATRRGNPPGPPSTPAPRLTLQPGIQATALPAITFTHVS